MPRILIVDDRDVNRYIRAEVLTKSGFEIIEAHSGADALEKCLTERPDLVLLDIHLPDISGFEVCRRIKSNPETSSIMVMQITASALDLTDALTGLEGGADDFLLEPIEPEFLVAKVRSLMRLRMAEERLRRSNADLERFAFIASHDLQQPLRAMVTFAELLGRDYSDKLDSRGLLYLKHVIDGGQRMSALIQDLLDYSHLSSTSAENNGSVDVANAVQQVREWLGDQLRKIDAVVECDPLPVVPGNEVRVVQLIRNLLENSIKYRRPDTRLEIRIRASRGRGEWIFAVSDNGKGFEPEFAEQIFGMFRRLDHNEVAGTGMGLAICRAVVENAGGKIWAEGRPGVGATFFFSWPASEKQPASAHS